MNYQTILVDSQLGLDGVSLLFAAVVRFSFMLVFWPWDFLFCCIKKSLKAWKHRFDFLDCLQPFDLVVLLFGQRQHLAY